MLKVTYIDGESDRQSAKSAEAFFNGLKSFETQREYIVKIAKNILLGDELWKAVDKDRVAAGFTGAHLDLPCHKVPDGVTEEQQRALHEALKKIRKMKKM